MFYVGMTLALVHEVLRIVLFWRMPGLYQGAPEAARPAVLARASGSWPTLSSTPFPGGAPAVVLAGMIVFFLWLTAAGVTLPRWRAGPA